MLLTFIAFIAALAILIAVHEWGHYRVAVACGVKVLRFSIGIGKPLWRYQKTPESTEFVIAALPLGGYVRMLDEREAPVDAHERHLAFNAQPLRSRAAIVAAGPLANLVLAILLYAGVNWWGVQEPEARLSRPAVGTVAQQAGVLGGELVKQVSIGDSAFVDVRSYEDLRWHVLQSMLDAKPIRFLLESAGGKEERRVQIELQSLASVEPDPQMMSRLGLSGPWTEAVLGELVKGGAAEKSGLKTGDSVLSIDGKTVIDGTELRALIRQQVRDGQAVSAIWRVERAGAELDISVMPDVVDQDGQISGRIGAMVGAAPHWVMVRYGFFEGLKAGIVRTWDVSIMSLRMIGRMLVGEASLKNLSGPLTIADYAGRTASMGLVQYLSFLALISVSLGVLNLLPLPVLDGGHLMYYLWEGVTGKSVSDMWMERLQRVGVVVLFAMMSIALFNDFSRLIG